MMPRESSWREDNCRRFIGWATHHFKISHCTRNRLGTNVSDGTLFNPPGDLPLICVRCGMAASASPRRWGRFFDLKAVLCRPGRRQAGGARDRLR
jgi:hypothetical protein